MKNSYTHFVRAILFYCFFIVTLLEVQAGNTVPHFTVHPNKLPVGAGTFHENDPDHLWKTIAHIVATAPTASVLATSTTICNGSSANLTVTITGGTPPYTVTIDNGVGTINNYTSGTNIPVSPTITTTYNLISVVDADGFTSSGLSGTPTITVLNYPVYNPILSAGVPYVCPGTGTNIIVTTQNDGYSYQVFQASNNATIGTPHLGNGSSFSVLTGPLFVSQTYYVVVSNGPCTHTGINTVTVTVIPDTTNPTLFCPANVNATTNAGCTAASLFLGIPMMFDNCGIASITNDAPANFPLGATTVTWTVTDNSGNFASCTQTVTVVDNVPPVITCPPPVTVNANAGTCSATGIFLGFAGATDNCSSATITNNAPAIYPVGINTVVWTATDNSGNTASCNQTVTVVDNQAPTIICPPNLAISTDFNACYASGVSLGTPVTADNCGVQSVSNNAPATFPIGITPVVWTVTDLYGNTANCTQNVTVTDNVLPLITCPPPVAANTDPGICTASGIVLGIPLTSDNCGVATVTNNAPAIYPVGVTSVIWTVTDIYGNIATCTQTVTITDIILPVINCPPAVNTNTDPGSCTASGVLLGFAGATDNCLVASIGNNAPASFPVGVTVVVWTATDNSGNTASCNQNITVVDNQPPTILCPPNLAISTDINACSASGVALGTPTTADNCGVISVTNNAPAIFPIGITSVIWTVTDLYGNTANCTQNVTVTDNVLPLITCPPPVAANTDPGICTASGIVLGIPLTSDNCGVATVTNNAPAIYPVGVTSVIWTVTDIYGNIATCTQTVTITDIILPVINCPPAVNTNTDPGSCTASGVFLGFAGATDNCLVASIGNNAPASFPVGVTVVVWTATDNSGNTASCNQNVTVVDNQPPTILCPPNLAISTDINACSASGVALGTPTTADNCGVISVTNNAPAIFPIGITSVIWTVTDLYGNTATCTQNVTVTDNVPPVIACPPPVAVNTDAGGCTASGIALGVPVTSDNCGVATVTNNAPAVFPIGNTPVIWTVTDIYGNTATCTQTVTVTDIIPPTISCPSDLALNTDPGICTASGVALGLPVNADNCGVANVSNNAPSTFPVGTTVVTWTVTDSSGNTTSCTQNVVVSDNQPPTIVCPPDIAISTDVNACSASGVPLGTPVTADNCGVISVTNNAPAIFPIGITTVIWTVTDLYGNTATCTQDITVTDMVSPLITCPSAISVNTDAGLCTASGILLGLPVTSDNCGVANVTNDAPAIYPIGNTSITWTVTDIYGNTSTCTQTITVTDIVPPTISCPSNLAIDADPGTCVATAVALGIPVSADNCGIISVSNNAPAVFLVGNTLVIWTVTDSSGNTDTCTQMVTVNGVPLAMDDFYTTEQDNAVSGDVTNNDLGLCNLPLTITGDTGPFNGTVVINSNGTFTYTPDSSFFGVDSFTYVICDATPDCDTATVYITVNDVNYPPEVVDTVIFVLEDSTVTYCTDIYDVDGSPPFSVSSGNCEENGTAIAVVAGTQVCVTYTPDPNYFGPDTACFSICDSLGACSTFTVIINVIPVNDPPVIADTSVTMYENDTLVLCIPFTDPEFNGPFSVALGCIENGSASAVINGNQLCITYIPDSGYIGPDTICVILCDGEGLCDTAIIDIMVLVNPHSFLGLAKSVTFAYQADGSFHVVFNIVAENIGDDDLSNIQIYDDLNLVFPSPATFELISAPLADMPLWPNLMYDGNLQTGLLTPSSSFLPAGTSASISFTVKVILNEYGEQILRNIAIGNADGNGPGGDWYTVSDTSDAGTVTDADNDGNPDELGENDASIFSMTAPGVAMPEGFSPDGNGINDLLVIPGILGYPENSLQIFNRWGNLVYEMAPYDNSWDALPNNKKMMIGGDKVQPGTYYYILDLHVDGINPIAGYLIIAY